MADSNVQAQVDALHREALMLHQAQAYPAALQKYRDVVQLAPDDADAWRNMAMAYYAQAEYGLALEAVQRSLTLDSERAIQYYSLGLILEQLGVLPQAQQAYEQAIARNPDYTNAYNQLGNLLVAQQQWQQAEVLYRRAIAANPQRFGSYLNLGNVLLETNQVTAAIQAYEQGLQVQPEEPDLLYNLGVALEMNRQPQPAALCYARSLHLQGQYQEAVDQYEQVLAVPGTAQQVYLHLADCYRRLNQPEKAAQVCAAVVRAYPQEPLLYLNWMLGLRDANQIEAAIAVGEQAVQLFPKNLKLTLEHSRLLPLLYDTPAEIDRYRQRLITGLRNWEMALSLDQPGDRQAAQEAIASRTNFDLVYQGRNDRAIQEQYGQIIHRIMAANYPDWVKPLAMPPLAPNQKIRIGYLSHHFYHYSGTLWLLGWLRYCDRQSFEIYCYYTDGLTDAVTQEFRLYSDHFHQIPGDLTAMARQILQDQLHLLILPEIGMSPLIMQMAALKLAPVMATAWGHPVTSGLPTLDYYLSSDLMEPEQAQEHYSETLVRLPNLAVAYPKPKVPELTRTRADFGLSPTAVVYFCGQAPFKYLPQHDYLFAEIARRVPQAQFVFIRADLLRPRLERAFRVVGLDYAAHCVFLPIQRRNDYLMLNLLADVYLDSLGFSGGNTTLDALACHLPVVTCPGEFMRGRLSAAMLQRIDLRELMAPTEQDYVAIATHLGQDPAYRQQIRAYLQQHHDRLFEDRESVTALEAFFRQVVRQRQSVGDFEGPPEGPEVSL